MPTTFSRTSRSLAQDSSRMAISAWLIGGLLLGIWLLWFLLAQVTVVEMSSRARLEVNQTAYPVTALIAGRVESVSMNLGQQVEAGEVLVTLDSRDRRFSLAEEESRRRALPPQIALLEQQIAASEQIVSKDREATVAAISSARSRTSEAGAAVTFANEYERRLSSLSDSGKGAVIETLRARSESSKLNSVAAAAATDLQRLKMDVQVREHQIQAELDDLRRELARLKGELDTADSTINRLRQEIDNHLIRASAKGRIGESAALQAGAYVAVGDKLASVVPSSELKIVSDFPPAAALGRIHEGQSAQMRLDGFPWGEFGTLPARVSRVGGEIRDNLVRVEFTLLDSPNSPIALQHGLPGTVEVNIERVSPALLVLRKSGQWLNRSAGSVPRNTAP